MLILANSDDPGSLRIARHYAAARQVPPANIIAMPMPTNETISWTEFISEIWSPLMVKLVRTGWINALPMDLVDDEGRRKYSVSGHRIAAMVVCRGVPLKIANDPRRLGPTPPLTQRPEFHTNECALDSELSLLPVPNHPITAFVPNPLFENRNPTELDEADVVKVSRLDGPTVMDALALVDHALTGEREGLIGRGYVDIANRDVLGDFWLANAAARLNELGFDTSVDGSSATFPEEVRFDSPVLYFGWYAARMNGPFALPGFRFPPGAIAVHIYSFSAATLRSDTSGWTGPLVARGVTATVGNVYEPYLGFTHRPNLLLEALSRGEDLVDAAYYSLRALSWQAVLIGDPLYRPFAVPISDQIQNISRLPAALVPYVVLRRANLLDLAGRHDEALALLRRWRTEHPSLAVCLALAARLQSRGDTDEAASALAPVTRLGPFSADQWGAAKDAAKMLAACGDPADAVEVWRTIFASRDLPPSLRRPWLGDAAAVAEQAGMRGMAEAWKSEERALAESK